MGKVPPEDYPVPSFKLLFGRRGGVGLVQRGGGKNFSFPPICTFAVVVKHFQVMIPQCFPYFELRIRQDKTEMIL